MKSFWIIVFPQPCLKTVDIWELRLKWRKWTIIRVLRCYPSGGYYLGNYFLVYFSNWVPVCWVLWAWWPVTPPHPLTRLIILTSDTIWALSVLSPVSRPSPASLCVCSRASITSVSPLSLLHPSYPVINSTSLLTMLINGSDWKVSLANYMLSFTLRL